MAGLKNTPAAIITIITIMVFSFNVQVQEYCLIISSASLGYTSSAAAANTAIACSPVADFKSPVGIFAITTSFPDFAFSVSSDITDSDAHHRKCATVDSAGIHIDFLVFAMAASWR